MNGRAATTNVIRGLFAISVGDAGMPCPAGWTWTPLTAVARLESGHTPSRRHPEWWGGEVPWIGIPDARRHHGGTIHETIQTTNEEGLANSSARLLPAGTVCLSRTASVGYVVVMGREMATSQDFVNWICSNAVVPDFLKNLFVAEKESLLRFAKGSTHGTIYFPEVKAIQVCLPPVNEQKRIVAKLEALQERSDAAKAALDAIPPLLEKLRQSVLASALRGDLTKSWREQHPDVEPASKLLERIRAERRRRWEEANPTKKYKEPKPVDQEGLPQLPEGWCWASLDELLVGITAGKSPKANGRPAGPGECGVLKVSAVSWGRFRYEENKALKGGLPAGVPTVRSGDLLVSRANTVELVGAVVLVEDEHPNLMLSDKTLRLDVVPHVDKRYLLRALRSAEVRAVFEDQATGTSNSMRNLSQEKIRSAPIPLPPTGEQEEIVERVFETLDVAAEHARRHGNFRAALKKLEQSLLAKAFRGELVPQDPDDEPAEALLVRIRAEREANDPPAPRTAKARATPRSRR